MNSKSIIFIFLIILSVSCKDKTTDKNKTSSSLKQSTDSIIPDTLSFEYFQSLHHENKSIPNSLYDKFIGNNPNENTPESVIGKSFKKVDEIFISSIEISDMSMSKIIIYDLQGKKLNHFNIYKTDDCNEPICHTKFFSFIEDTIISVQNELWGGEPFHSELTLNDTTVTEKYRIKMNGDITKVPTSVDEKIEHYICYTNDNKKEMMIWVGFDSNSKALQIKYKGMAEPITLIPAFFGEEKVFEENDGIIPMEEDWYLEFIDGKINGSYKLTHQGIWDYVEYTRWKDSKKFNFTIDHNSNNYVKTPCFW